MNEQLEAIISAVKRMRKLQKDYFATRDREILKESKRQEKVVDLLINEFENGQTKLF